MMGTFDEVTKQYFMNSKVNVKLSYRTGKSSKMKLVNYEVSHSIIYRSGSITGEFYWSHHQKTIILDAPIDAEYAQNLQTKLKTKKKKTKTVPTRRIIAFVGGLDLTSGRWDTPSHSLFKTLTVSDSVVNCL